MPIGYQKEIDNNPQSQTSPVFGYLFQTFDKDDIHLTAPALADSTTVTISADHGFTGATGEHILIYENNHLSQNEVEAGDIDGNTITLKTPIDIPFTTNAIVVRGCVCLNKNYASGKDIWFEILDGTIPIDLSSIILTFESAAEPDDGTFGGIAALTNGQYFRQINGRNINLGNYKKNIDFRRRRANVLYEQKGAGKIYSTTIIFDFETMFTQSVRIDPRTGDKLLTHIRDDLSSLSRYNISITGSYTSGE